MRNKYNSFAKTGYIGILIITVIILACFFLIDSHSFGFSQKSGFYDEPFDLYIRKPFGTKVFYTLDGSTPTEKSTEYTKPIRIEDATNNSNVYSNIEEIVPNYDEDKNRELNYIIPKENIDKCNVVRAICVDSKGEVLEEKQASYFVGFEKKSGYGELWICSIVTDPRNLFDSKDGILVRGDNIREIGDDWYTDANYLNRGPEWEREAFVQFYNPSHNVVVNQKCGLRVHGQGSCRYVSKSFSLYARNEYDGNDKFRCDFWGNGLIPEKIMLYSGGEDGETLVRNALVSDLTRDLAYSSYHYIPCVMFLDGEYWGIHFITEKFDKEFFNHYCDVEKDDLLVMKEFLGDPEYALTEGLFDMEEDSKKWNDFAVVISGREEMGLNQDYFESVFDYESFLDYFSTEFYIARCSDWPERNIAFWSTRNYGTGLSDGKWRMILYDVYRQSMYDASQDTISAARGQFPLLDYALEMEQFQEDLKLKFIELGNTVFSDESVGNYLDEYSKLMREPILKHYKRFYGDKYDGESFDEAIEGLKTFFRERKDYLRNYSFE